MPKIKIEDMDHYEILNVSRTASFREIEKAFLIGKSAYSKDSLAHYTLLKDEERQQMLDRIEAAFMILGDEEKRQAYNENTLNKRDSYKEKAQFRQSTERMIFEDPYTDHRRTHFFRRLFSSAKKD
jgi:DnaJ-class molecular chaperone